MRLSLTFFKVRTNYLFEYRPRLILVKEFIPEWVVHFFVVPPRACKFLTVLNVRIMFGWKLSVKETIDSVPEDAIVGVVAV